jgi:hypothetical protein
MSGFTPPWLSGSGYGETQHRVGEGDPGPAFNPTYPNLELLKKHNLNSLFHRNYSVLQ